MTFDRDDSGECLSAPKYRSDEIVEHSELGRCPRWQAEAWAASKLSTMLFTWPDGQRPPGFADTAQDEPGQIIADAIGKITDSVEALEMRLLGIEADRAEARRREVDGVLAFGLH
jgi:hypothetical protein